MSSLDWLALTAPFVSFAIDWSSFMKYVFDGSDGIQRDGRFRDVEDDLNVGRPTLPSFLLSAVSIKFLST